MALSLKDNKIEIDDFKCKGCGVCVPICPTRVIDMEINSTHEIISKIEVLAKTSMELKVIAFCCLSCGYAAADHAGTKRISYSPNVFIVRVPCIGRIDSEFILKSFELGFDGVLIFGCSGEACRYLGGNKKAENKVEAIANLLEDKKESILYVPVSAVDGTKFANTVNDFVESIVDVQ